MRTLRNAVAALWKAAFSLFIAFVVLTAGYFAFCGWTETESGNWKYHLPTDEMTGEKDYSNEKVGSFVDIEGRPWWAVLAIFCYGEIKFAVNEDYYSSSKQIKQVPLDSVFSSELGLGITQLRLKFDDNEPTIKKPWVMNNPWQAALPPSPEVSEWSDNMRKEITKQMKKHRRLWIEFEVENTPYIAKFDLTGFSRELAKCSKIPDTS